MARQSRLPSFLLTRPAAQGDRFAAALRRRFGSAITIINTPLMAAQFLTPTLPDIRFQALIFTSETGVLAFQQVSAEIGLAAGAQAWCVGDRTASAARAAGLTPLSAKGDAEALLRAIVAARPSGALLHLHGKEVRGNLADRLVSAGIETYSSVIYAQQPQPLTPQACAALQARDAILLPLFSPRTAALFCAEAQKIQLHAPLWAAALSPAVAAAIKDLPVAGLIIAAHPDAEAMLGALADLIAAANHA
ncbi:MAG: uroporphyrinogen-III synthase [Pseudorhodobacter sp.]|nr:uroporphyrinogen-III synthase [Pseudorhodobacter sp.]